MAGGFFSGGSSDAVNASVAEAEAAAREAEAARDEINDKFVEFAGQTDEGDYTVPNADDALTTKFLRQDGTWVIPATGADGATTLAELTDTDISSPTDNQYLRYDGTNWINETVDSTGLTAGTGIDITNDTINIADDGVGTTQLAPNAVTSAKIPAGGVARTNIADNAIDDGKLNATNTGSANQILSAVGDGSFTWVDADGNTAYTASDGITLDSDDFSLTDGGVGTDKIADDAVTSAKILDDNVTADELNVTGDGNDGQVLSSDGAGGFTWEDNNGGTDTTYTAGTGLDLTGTVFSVADGGIDTVQIASEAINESKLNATNTPLDEQLLSANTDGTFTWITPAAGTIYTAGTGLDLTGDEFSISDDGVDTTQLADNAVDADKLNVTGDGNSGQFLASDGDGSFTWTASTNSLEGLTDTNIPAGGPSVRSFLEYNTTDDTWDATAATEFLNISELFDVDITNVANNQFLRYNGTDDRWENESITIPANLTFSAPLSRSGTTVSLPNGSIGIDQLADDAVDADKLSVSGTSGQILSTNSSGDLAWIDADGNTAYTAGTGLSLTGDEFSVTPNGITNALLANNSVRTENITDGTITGTDMADGTVGTDQLEDDAVTAAKIADNTITAAQVASNSLGATELATGSVSSFKLQDNAVIAGKIANNVVGADELDVSGDGTSGQFLTSEGDGSFSWTTSSGGTEYTADGTTIDLSVGNEFSVADNGIDTAQIANQAVDTLQIANNAITGTQLAPASVDTSELDDDAVTTAKLNDGAVTTAKLNDGAVTSAKITTGTIVATDLSVSDNGTAGQVLASDGDGSFSWVNEISVDPDGGLDEDNSGRISIGDDSINSARLADNSVSVDAIIDGVITEPKLSVTGTGTDGQVLSLSGTGFVWVDDANTDTTYTAGTGLDLTGTTFSVADQGVTVAKLAQNIPISTFSDVNTSGVNNGQVLGYNGTTWVPVDANGGNTDNSRLVITPTPSSLNEGDNATDITIALTIGNMIDGETISGQSVTVTDPTGHAVAVTGSDNTWAFSGNGDNVGNYVIRASATFTLTGGATSVHSSSNNLPVIATPADNINWYQWVTDTQPTAITSTDVVDNGVFSSPETGTWTRPTEDTDSSELAYVALPTGTYTFHAGLLFASITDLGVISTDYTLYRLDDFPPVTPGGNRIITITET